MNKDSKKELIKEAIKEYRQEENKQRKNRIYHNTELLMKNYNELKQHADNAVYKSYHETEDELDYDILYIDSILKSKVRTTIIVLHIDMALDILKKNADKGGYISKFDVMEKIFIFNTPYDELAIQYKCDSSTIRRWKNDVLSKLSILLFGEEGLISLA